MPPYLRLAHDRCRCQREGTSTYMGHASITITLDRYGHLMPGSENEAAGLLDVYLERAVAGEK
jgi:integrase